MPGGNPSAAPGAKTEAGCRRMPRLGQRTSGLAQSDKSFQGMIPYLIFLIRIYVFSSASSVDRTSGRGRDAEGGPA